jgi:hypothetical protein
MTTHLRISASSFSLVISASSSFALSSDSIALAILQASMWATWLTRMARSSAALRYNDDVCGIGTMSQEGKNESFLLTWSSELASDISHCWSSLCKVDTSSTEHFFAATLATLSSSRAASRLLETFDPLNKIRSSSAGISLGSSGSIRSLGVGHRLAVKSMRIKRTESFVKFSRQNGQTGESRGGVFSTIFLQHFAHRTWPARRCGDQNQISQQRFFSDSPHGIE